MERRSEDQSQGEGPTAREHVLRKAISEFDQVLSEQDRRHFGSWTPEAYGVLETEDKYWALVHTRTNKVFVEGVVRIVAGRRSAAELTDDETRRLVELASPIALNRMAPDESDFPPPSQNGRA